METRKIGSLDVSVVGLGCNNFGGRLDEKGTRVVVDAALDAGITLFDTADIYGGRRSEEFVGRALAGCRDDVVIATKFGMGDGTDLPAGASAASVAAAIEGSLRRLGTDRIDLFQLHLPDDATDIGETLEALSELVRKGDVGEIGCSNYDGKHIDEAAHAASERGTARFVSVQNELSLLCRGGEAELVAACARNDLQILSRAVCSRASTTAERTPRPARVSRACPPIDASKRCRKNASTSWRRSPRSHARGGTPCSSWRPAG
jgi:aryl-alcohol dehydrogenase-like predicted oxidoreductase